MTSTYANIIKNVTTRGLLDEKRFLESVLDAYDTIVDANISESQSFLDLVESHRKMDLSVLTAILRELERRDRGGEHDEEA